MNDKTIMILTALASILCAIWAFTVPTRGMLAAMVMNAEFCIILAFVPIKIPNFKKILNQPLLPLALIILGLLF